jgi:hypothetical protein
MPLLVPIARENEQSSLLASGTDAAMRVNADRGCLEFRYNNQTHRVSDDWTQGEIGVVAYGAVGDGVTDDTAAIQAAIDAALLAPRRGSVVAFPPGIYRTTAPLLVAAGGIVLKGENSTGATAWSPLGWAGPTIMADFDAAGAAEDVILATRVVYRMQIKGIRVTAAPGRTKTLNGITLRECSECRLEDVQANGGLVAGFKLDGVTITQLVGCHSLANTHGVEFALSGSYGYNNTFITLRDCDLYQNTNAIHVTGSVNLLRVYDCYIEDWQNAIYIEQTAAAYVSFGNVLVHGTHFNSVGTANPRVMLASAHSGAAALQCGDVHFDNCVAYCWGATACIEYLVNANVHADSYLGYLRISDSTWYGDSLTSVVASDTGNTSAYFFGNVWASQTLGEANRSVALVDATVRMHSFVTSFGAWDMSGSLPLRLPTGAMLSYATEGLLGYHTGINRMVLTDGANLNTIPIEADVPRVYNVKGYGAVGNGSTDDTVAIQAAITACPSGGTVYLPTGSYLLSAGLTITLPITVCGSGFGSGSGSILLVKSTVGATTDIITCTPAANHEGLHFRDFGILPESGTPGRDGIVFEVTTYSWSKASVQRVFIRAKAGRAIKVNNPNLDHDAFWCSQILDNVLEGGVYLLGAGDSINIHRNILTTASGAATAGKGAGVEAKILSAADPASAGDSKLLSIAYNNITAQGGAVWVKAGVQTKILYNNIECPAGLTTQTNKALIDLDGDATHLLWGCEVRGNYCGATSHNVNDAIRCNYTVNAVIEDNTIEPSGGYGASAPYDTDWYGIRQTANALYTRIGKNSWPYPTWNGSESKMANVAGQTEVYQIPNAGDLAYSASMQPKLGDASHFTIPVGNGTAFTIQEPVASGSARFMPYVAGMRLTITIKNVSGGAVGTITWHADYKMAAWTSPATGYQRSITFEVDSAGKWIELHRTAADVPNP